MKSKLYRAFRSAELYECFELDPGADIRSIFGKIGGFGLHTERCGVFNFVHAIIDRLYVRPNVANDFSELIIMFSKLLSNEYVELLKKTLFNCILYPVCEDAEVIRNISGLYLIKNLIKNGFFTLFDLIESMNKFHFWKRTNIVSRSIVFIFFAPEIDSISRTMFDSYYSGIVEIMRNPDNSTPSWASNFISFFFRNIDELRQNQWFLLNGCFSRFSIPDSIVDVVRRDDIDQFTIMSSSPMFNINEKIDVLAFEPAKILMNSPSIVNLACYYGSIKIFKYLLLNKVKVSSIDDKQIGIATFAFSGGNLDIIHELFSLGYLFGSEEFEYSILFRREDIINWVFEQNFINDNEKVEFFLKKSIEYRNFLVYKNFAEFSSTIDQDSMNDCINNQSFPILSDLLDNGIIDSKQLCSKSVIAEALRFGLTDIVELIMRHQNSNVEDYISIIAAHSTSSFLSVFLSESPSLIHCMNNDRSLLSFAVYGDNISVIQYLLSYQHNCPNWSFADDNSILIEAVEKGIYDVCFLLLNYQGINVNCKDVSSQTPLQLAVFKGSFQTVLAMYASNMFDFSIMTNDGYSLLDLAFKGKSYNTIKFLKSIGQITNYKPEIMAILLESKKYEITKTYIEEFDFVPELLILATQKKNFEIARYLVIEKGYNPTNRLPEQLSPLELAYQNKDRYMLSLYMSFSKEIIGDLDTIYQYLDSPDSV